MSEAVRTKYGSLLLGAASLGAQTLLIRSALTVFYGNELLIGGVLALWLFWVGLGSGLVSLFLSKKPSADRIFTLLISGLFFCGAGILSFRLARLILTIPYGEYIPFLRAVIFTGFVTALPCLLFGASFALLAAVDHPAQGEPAARIYAWETGSAAVCGVLLSLATPYASNLALWAVLFTTALTASAALLRNKRHLLMGTAALVILLTGRIVDLERRIHSLYWHSFAKEMEYVDARPTKFGETAVVNYAGEMWVYKNGSKVAPISNDSYAQPLAAAIACAHARPRRILIVEGFLSGLPAAFLKFDSLSVTALEFDRLSLEFVRHYADTAFAAALSHPRLTLLYKDAFHFLQKSNEHFDIIVINTGAPTTAAAGRFYSEKFLVQIKNHLAENGLLAVPRIRAGENYLGEEAALFHCTLFSRLRKLFLTLAVLPGDEAVYLAGNGNPFTFCADSLSHRYTRIGANLTFFHPAMFAVLYDSLRSAELSRQIHELTDAFSAGELPAEYLADFLFWHKTTSGKSFFAPLLRLSFFKFTLLFFSFVSAGFLLLLFVCPAKSCRMILYGIAGLVGFSIMTMNFVLLLAFQMQFGYIYAWLAVLSAAFMIGMSVSAALFNQRVEQFGRRCLNRILGFMMFLSLFLLPLMEWSSAKLSVIFALPLFLITGASGGAAFAVLCAQYRASTGGSDLGGIYAADVFGSGTAAFLLSGCLIPLFGLERTMHVAVLILMSALVLSVVVKRGIRSRLLG